MLNHLKILYSMFRPIIAELSKENINFTNNVTESEFKLFEKLLNKNMSELVSNPDIAESIFYKLVRLYEDNENNNSNSYEPKIQYLNHDLNQALNILKKEDINVVWVLTDSGAALKGFTIHPTGIEDRKAKKALVDLLNIWEFPDKAKNIFLTKDARGKEIVRLNGITSPKEFLDEMYSLLSTIIFKDDEIIKKYYKKEMWKKKYNDLKTLLRKWFKSGSPITEIDFLTYNKTIEILSSLIPLTTENDILKTKYQYEEDANVIESSLYEYYKKNTNHIKNLYLQEIDKLGELSEKINEIIDFIYTENFHTDQKTILAHAYTSYINTFLKASDEFMHDMKTYQKRYHNSSNLDFDYYKQQWMDVTNHYEE